jgi:hypothetical protein
VWTTPRTWVTAEIVTAAAFNDHLRDNFNFVRGFPRAYSVKGVGSTDGTTSGTTELAMCQLDVPAQDVPYRLIPSCFLSGNISVAGDTFEFRIRADTITGTVLAFITELFPGVTGGRHVCMTYAIPIEVNSGGPQSILATAKRSAGTGTWADSGALTGHTRLGALVIPQEGV